MSVQPPVLLDSGTPVTTSAVSVTLSVDDIPTAKITTPEDIRMHTFMEIFTAQGSAGIFRVTDRVNSLDGLVELSLRGALDTLSDDLYPGETPIKGTIPEVITAILAKQTTVRWQIGTSARQNRIRVENSYTNLLELLSGVMAEAPGCRWVCDYSTTPWTLNLAELDATVVAGFRIGRNVSSVSVDMSDAEMCTRLYMTVSTDSASRLYTFDNTAAQAEWGIICKTADVNADNCPDPAAYGAQILAERAQPIAFITIDGYDLQSLTGDAFDRITLGSHCRVELDGYASAWTEVVTRIEWPDAINEPQSIKVSLANNLKPFAEQLNLMKRSGGGMRRQIDEQERELVRHRADIEKSDERILLWATEEEWDEIAQEYEETGRSQVEIVHDEINLRVEKGDVATQLSVEVGNVTITGGNLIVDGMITAEGLETMDITVASLHADYVSVGNGGVVLDDTSSSVTASSYTMNSYNGDLVDSIKDVQVVSVAGSQNYKLQYKTFAGDTWTDAGTFNRATLMSGTWDSGILTVLPDSNGSSSLYYYLQQGSTSWSGSSGTIPVMYSTTQGGPAQATGYTFTVSRSGSITAASPQSSAPSGSNLRTVTVGTGGGTVYVRVSSTGYRSNSDYIQINY